MLTEDQKRLLELRDSGLSRTEIAEQLGLTVSSVKDRLERARKRLRKMEQNPGISDALQKTGVSPDSARFGYRRVQDEEGNFNTVFWRLEEEEARDYAEELAGVFEGIDAAEPVKEPNTNESSLCTLMPFTDVHAGMMSWGRETGQQDYDLKHFRQDVAHAYAKLDPLTPASETALLVLNGDTFHSDDGHVTPENRHQLDTDGRQSKVLDTGVEVFVDLVKRMLYKHKRVRIRVLRGNHDKHSHLALSLALRWHYVNEPRVHVEDVKFDLFQHQHGRTAIFAHHGDKAPAQRLVLYITDVCPFWSDTRHRYVFTGHVHHEMKKDYGAITFESLRAFCPPDAYAAGLAFAQRRAVQSLTFHDHDGLVLRAVDPLEHR